MEVFKLFGTIALDAKEALATLKKVAKEGDGTESKLSKAFSTIGKGAVAVGKVMATGFAVGATACASLATAAIKSYADYEQLVGGAQLLFGDAFGYVEEQAKNAYKTVQMSTNDYLTQVNGFSTGLKTALGGNEQAAAELAHKIVVAEADIIAATGNTSENIQNAFNGIMKSNFTMLDNLQLGITPTKEGFQEVIDKVNDWNAANGKATQYQIDNLADCQSALVDYVEMQGLAGYASDEAAKTIQGSWGMLKGAWSNLMTGFSDPAADMQTLINNVFESVNTFAQNLVPRITQVLSGISTAFTQLIPMLTAEIPGLLSQVLPSLIEGVISLVNGVISIIPSLIELLTSTVLPQLLTGMTSIFEALISALPQGVTSIVSALPVLIPQLISGLVSMIVILCSNFSQIIMPIIDSLPLIITSICNALLMNLPQLIMGVGQLILGLAMAIPQLCTALWETVKGIFSTLLSNMAVWFAPITQWFSSIWQGFIQIVSTCWETIKNAISVALKLIGSIISAAISIITLPFRLIWENCKEYVFDAFEWIKEKIDAAIEFIKNLVQTGFNFVKKKIIDPINDAKNKVFEVFEDIKTTISDKIESAKRTVQSVFDNIKSKIQGTSDNIKSTVTTKFNAIRDAIKTPIEKARDLVKGAIDRMKSFFNFSWSLPKLKLPHFSFSGSFSLNPPSVPKFSVQWYKKAMMNPMLLTSPTIFGYDPSTGQYQGGGEAGSEVVSGTSTLMSMIGAVVEGKMSGMTGQLVEILTAILNAIVDGNEETLQALLDGKVIKIGEREFGRLVREYA